MCSHEWQEKYFSLKWMKLEENERSKEIHATIMRERWLENITKLLKRDFKSFDKKRYLWKKIEIILLGKKIN